MTHVKAICVLSVTLLTCVACAPQNSEFYKISFDDTVQSEDRAYVKATLGWARTNLGDWYEYIVGALPFTLVYNPAVLGRGRAGQTTCCDRNGAGRIEIGYQFGQVALPGSKSDSWELNRLSLLSLLVHESTHVLDLRAQRFADLATARRCRLMEQTAFQKQLQFWRALNSTSVSVELRGLVAEQVILQARRFGNPHFWDFYCGGLSKQVEWKELDA